MDTIVVNLFGEPSAGKSTCAMDITAQLKRHGINAEYVSEFAKDKVYENNGEVFKHQEYLFGKQSFKMGRVKNKVQVMVVDSPLILCAVYNTDKVLGEDFNKTVLNVFNSYNNRNYLLTRYHSYENEGRFQKEDEAKEVRKEIIDKLNQYNIKYEEIASTESNCEYIVEEVMEEMNSKGHLFISLGKSAIRVIGGIVTLVNSSIIPLAVGIIVAEVGGVLEELVDER